MNLQIEKQARQILVQEEANDKISIQLRYWRSKTMSLEASIYLCRKKEIIFCYVKFFYIESLLYLLGSNSGYKSAIGTDK